MLQTVGLLSDSHGSTDPLNDLQLRSSRMILVTGHRRENFGPGLANLSHALVDLVKRFDDVTVVYSVHPKPNVREPVERILGSHERIRVIQPPDYFRFVALMNESFFIIMDSGGIQEEAPSLKKPVLVVRNVTERLEAVECCAAVLVRTDRETIVRESSMLLESADHYKSMVVDESPFGEGHAAERIVDSIESFLSDRDQLSANLKSK